MTLSNRGTLIPEITRRGFKHLLEAPGSAAIGTERHEHCAEERAIHHNDCRRRRFTTEVGISA